MKYNAYTFKLRVLKRDFEVLNILFLKKWSDFACQAFLQVFYDRFLFHHGKLGPAQYTIFEVRSLTLFFTTRAIEDT